MRRNNTLSLSGYFSASICSAWLMLYTFYTFSFSRICNPFTGEVLGLFQSLLFLAALTAVCVTACFLVTFRRQRTRKTALLNALIPLEIYSLLCVFPYRRAMTAAALGVGAVLTAALAISTFLTAWPGDRPRSAVLKKRVLFFLSRMRLVVALCLLCFLPTLIACTVFGAATLVPSAAAEGECQDSSFAGNADTVVMLNEEYWSGLSAAERLDVLQKIVDMESAYLGTPSSPRLTATILPDGTSGQFNTSDHSISIDIKELDRLSAGENLNTVLHEEYHYYQLCLCECYETIGEDYRSLRIFNIVEVYGDNFENYCGSGDAYYNQPLEITARAYAAETTGIYMEWAEEFLSEGIVA